MIGIAGRQKETNVQRETSDSFSAIDISAGRAINCLLTPVTTTTSREREREREREGGGRGVLKS